MCVCVCVCVCACGRERDVSECSEKEVKNNKRDGGVDRDFVSNAISTTSIRERGSE